MNIEYLIDYIYVYMCVTISFYKLIKMDKSVKSSLRSVVVIVYTVSDQTKCEIKSAVLSTLGVNVSIKMEFQVD